VPRSVQTANGSRRGGEDRAIHLWHVPTGKSLGGRRGIEKKVRSLSFHPDGRTLASTADAPDGDVRLWDLATLTARPPLAAHVGGAIVCVWRGDGGLLLTSGNSDGSVRAWDMTMPAPRGVVFAVRPAGAPGLHGLALSPEGRHFAVGNADGTISVFKLAAPGVVFPNNSK